MIEYFETDKIGKHKVVDNGKTKTRVLIEPSEWYIEKQKKRHDEHMENKRISDKREKAETLIQQRIKENAIKELQEENILDSEGNLND